MHMKCQRNYHSGCKSQVRRPKLDYVVGQKNSQHFFEYFVKYVNYIQSN